MPAIHCQYRQRRVVEMLDYYVAGTTGFHITLSLLHGLPLHTIRAKGHALTHLDGVGKSQVRLLAY
jgi:hypothetical protein